MTAFSPEHRLKLWAGAVLLMPAAPAFAAETGSAAAEAEVPTRPGERRRRGVRVRNHELVRQEVAIGARNQLAPN